MLYVSGRIRGRTVSSFLFTCVDTDVPLQLGHVSECYVAAWRDDRRLEIGFVNCISNNPPKEGTTRREKGREIRATSNAFNADCENGTAGLHGCLHCSYLGRCNTLLNPVGNLEIQMGPSSSYLPVLSAFVRVYVFTYIWTRAGVRACDMVCDTVV